MSGMTHTNFSTTLLGRLMKGPRLWALLGLLLARAALGTDALYENDGIVIYNGAPGTYPPMIDAINFVNNGTFTINTVLYETWNTINYTNNSLMSSDVGFRFDTQTTGGSRLMAGSFYNPGEVDCGSQFLAWATNIVNPGTVNVPGILTTVNLGTGASGVAGLMQFTGQNVDLSRSTLVSAGGQGNHRTVGLLGLKDADTNSDWDASFDLGPTYAYPAWPVSFLPAPPNGFGFPNLPLNTTPYFNQVSVGTNLVIIRSVFIQDTSPNVSYNVYFDSGGLGFGGGNATVEWRGGYVDPATGNPATNYLYLNDNYLQGVATNQVFFNGIPDNFTFSQGLTQAACLPGTPATNGFFDVFSSGFVTNRFAYVSAQLIATSAGISDIPNGAITNLPSRIQISASRELNLELAQIAQPDYLSLQSTNQFDGNAGAHIAAPFSDINLGVTNGYLTISNLLPQSYPVWGGTVQAWSTRWLVLATNFVGTNAVVGTNDYRVLIVASQLTPTVAGHVQDLILHATNSLVLSDAFNVMRKLSIDAQKLTLTTNAPGNGATSADGELNLESPNILWPTSLPNLRWLTNNGAISTMNLANFGSSAVPYTNFINRGRVSNLGGSAIWALDFENSGSFFSGTNSDFVLHSLTTVLANGSIIAGGNVSITTGSLVASNLVLQAGRSLTLQATNLLTDTGAANGNSWSVGGLSLVGLNLPIKPLVGDLLGTTIFMRAPAPNKQVVNTWAGLDYGVSTAGYTNNEAIGVLILDALGASSSFKFNGTGVSNAIYVDDLELRDYATNFNGSLVNALSISPNLVIYYAQAMVNGVSVAEKLNGLNNNHLRWVPMYTGYFSSTNLIYTNADGTITTNGPFNAALAQSTTIDSNGNGIVNANDPTPFFVSSEVNFKLTLNNPPLTALLTWDSIPSATNTVYYRTNLVLGNWLPLTTNISPSLVPPAGGWPITNTITIAVTNTSVPHFYRVRVDPNSALLYGP
jgi:hypothetical protein